MKDVLIFCLCVYSSSVWGDDIDYKKLPPVSWPQLEMKIEVQSQRATTQICKKLGYERAEACAAVNFTRRTCVMYLPEETSVRLFEHELAHCLGYDHYGDNILQDAWRKYESN